MKLVGPRIPAGGPPYSLEQIARLAAEISAADAAARLWARIYAQRRAIRDFAKGL